MNKQQIKKLFEDATRKFLLQYKDIPGVLGIDKDGFFSDSILVFIDKTKFDTKLPKEFEGFSVSVYDVRYILAASNQVLDLIKEEKLDVSSLTGDNKNTYNHFVRTAEICKEMLSR
jgi:hypothetical protein